MFLVRRCLLCGAVGEAPCDRCWARLAAGPSGPIPALLAYEEDARFLLRRLKFGNGRAVVARLARGMAGLVEPGWADVVTWAPTSAVRKRERGYDQAELLARAVARCLGVPCRAVLRRAPGHGPQTGRTRAERLDGPVFVGRRQVVGRVLVIDDVVTTGATLRSAASAIRALGAFEVRMLAAAATPKHVPTHNVGVTGHSARKPSAAARAVSVANG
jgi:predicted amidophosphoribosyltransferase